jgi:hypothetical protein
MGFARVYVYCGGKLDYDTWVDNLVNVLQAGKGAAQASRMYESEDQKQAVLDYYDDGIALFEDLANAAEDSNRRRD